MKLTHDEALARLHETMLEILDAFAEFCAAHDLPWFLAFGTTLGAIRHNGFIPWDDDADVGMLRADYERFLEIVNAEGFVPGFSVRNARNTPHFDGIMTKIFKDGTKFYDRRAVDEGFDQGIFIDVFPHDPLYADPKKARRQLRDSRFWLYLLYLRNSPHNRVPHGGWLGKVEAALCTVAHPVVKALFSEQRILDRFDRNVPGPDADVQDVWVPLPYFRNNRMETLFPTSDHAFEDRVYPVPHLTDEYLQYIFGDWRHLPPPDQRKSHLPVLIDFGDGDYYESEQPAR